MTTRDSIVPKVNGAGIKPLHTSNLVPHISNFGRGPGSLFMPDQRKVIAIVDDEQTMLKAIERLLTARGFATQGFVSAEAFLDSSTAQDAACLVLDIHLGGMSGIELRRRLKAVRSTIPVIFITAVDDEAVHREAMDAGCVACLRKPFQGSLLISAIDKATG